MSKQKVLVINAGSSSIKLSLFDKRTLQIIANGIAERITLGEGKVTIKYNSQAFNRDVTMPNHTVAVENILDLMSQIGLIDNPEEIELIGFRVVHGGPYFTTSVKLNANEIDLIEKAKIYAPLHNPGAVQAMKAFKKVMPHAKMSVDFDTAFHTSIPDVNAIYPIPYQWSEELKIRRFGAHGISHEFITLKLQEILKKQKVNLVNLHIGNGASLCAIKDNKSIDTSMGLTPLAGIMMGSRSGDIDPSIHEFISEQLGLNIHEITEHLNKKSGLLGVSGISSDVRDITKAIEEKNKRAEFAFELYAQKIADFTALYANKIGSKLDAIVFTAGVGENTPSMRQRVIDKLHFAKIKIDDKLNNSKIGEYALISTKDSDVKVYVIRTNEELLIAKHAIELYK
ncbi:acetate/propionate family kinase [Mycoplasmopsis caviae]|uniref:Acetate kinase n=1 Tax=Mycoplasmopsis caviae TaxID=55603 RepID=A0A3P8MFA3_9BACT|nr:acetate/propionate family kinase [Mycoplasmopsis caviae]UUD35051.1 acetate/propionate family kinase [Mycoplasmopsis caviae]VDR42123.1 acetate kinase [Mycoplasmopsis caviae]